MNLNRRQFIKGLMAAAVASQVPMSFETAEQLAEFLHPQLFVNGQPPTGVQDVGNGWYRLWWQMKSPDVIHLNTKLDNAALIDLTKNPYVEKGEPVTMSLYAKDAGPAKALDGLPCDKNIWGVQLEAGPMSKPYERK